MIKEYKLSFQVNQVKTERIVRPGAVSRVLDIEHVVPFLILADHFWVESQ
jgi:hypothetical protein